MEEREVQKEHRDDAEPDAGRDQLESEAHAEQAKAEAEQAQAEQAKAEAERAKAEAERHAAEEEQSRRDAEQSAREEEKKRKEAEKQRKDKEKKRREEKEEEEEEEKRQGEAIRQSVKDATEAGIPRQVALYAQWEGSSARARARAALLLSSLAALILLFVATGLVVGAATERLNAAVGWSCGGGAFVLSLLVFAKGVLVYAGTLVKFLDEREQMTALVEQDQGRQTGRDKELDELLRLNRTQMQAYQTLSRGQQRSAFRSSLIALFVGLIVLVGGIVVVVVVEGNTSKIAVAGVTALGSALSSYIASTYLKLHGAAARQLRFFSDQPIVSSYIYEAERLVGKLPTDERPESYKVVIKDILGLAHHPAMIYSQAEAEQDGATQGDGAGHLRIRGLRSRGSGKASATSPDQG